MKIEFHKMTGAGNDFILLDNRQNKYSNLSKSQIANLCNRHFGIGSDGLMMVENTQNDNSSKYMMRYYNSDGGEADMCGNGARCFANYLDFITQNNKKDLPFLTQAGMITAKFYDEDVCIELSEPSQADLDIQVNIDNKNYNTHHINTGVEHLVYFNSNVDNIDIKTLGSKLRWHKTFQPKGANVNFVEIIDDNYIKIRTYERGVEDETLACGTGMVASAIIYYLKNLMQDENSSELKNLEISKTIKVKVRSDENLKVSFVCYKKNGQNNFKNVTLTGSAKFVFTGEIVI